VVFSFEHVGKLGNVKLLHPTNHTSQVWTAGQVIGLIHDIPTCHDLVHRIEQEALDTLKKTQSLIVDKQPEPDIIGKPMGDLKANPKSEQNKAPGVAQIYDIGKAKL
jgi:hypothetical protein